MTVIKINRGACLILGFNQKPAMKKIHNQFSFLLIKIYPVEIVEKANMKIRQLKNANIAQLAFTKKLIFIKLQMQV